MSGRRVLVFSERRKLSILYKRWVEKNKVAENPFMVITFLQAYGLLDVVESCKFIKENWRP